MHLHRQILYPLALSALLLLPLGAQASTTVYKCVGANGKLSLQQSPCQGQTTQTVRDVKPAQTLDSSRERAINTRR